MNEQDEINVTLPQIGAELCLHILAGVLVETGVIPAANLIKIVDNLIAEVGHPEVCAPLFRMRDAVEQLTNYAPPTDVPTDGPRSSILKLIPGGRQE